MKIKLFTLSIIFFAAFSVEAQEINDKRHETTLLFRNFDDIGIGYRFGTSSALWRISVSGGISKNENVINDSTLQGTNNQSIISMDFGREYRFKVADNLFLRIGGDVFYSRNVNYSDNGENEGFQYSSKIFRSDYGLKIVSGVIFQPTEGIHLGFEFLPSFSKIMSEFTATTKWDQEPSTVTSISNDGFAFNLNNSVLRFNVGFNF